MVGVLQVAVDRRASAQCGVKMLDPERTAEMVVAAKHGDATAFTALVRAFLRPAYAIALSVLRRPADAEDVAQDALLVAFEKLDTCNEPRRFAGWLLTIARRRALNALGSRKVREAHAKGDGTEVVSSARWPDQVGLRERLLQALDQLSPLQCQVVLLCDLEGWTHAEVGTALGISELMSRQHLFNARRKLRGLLATEGSVEAQHDR